MPVHHSSRLRPLRHLYLFLAFTLSLTAFAAEIRGTVRDSLGAVVPTATVNLLDARLAIVATTTSDGEGIFHFTIDHAGRYSVRAAAAGFAISTSDAVYLAQSQQTRLDVILKIGEVQQNITVTATGLPVPQSQVGASVTVLDGPYSGTLNVDDSLRLVPGVQVTTVGQRGAQTSLFIRGGTSSSNKVLVDGVPANDIGGFTDFASLEASAYSQIEIYRGPNSALFGQDALAGVVNLTTARGSTALPLLTYAVDGGNFGTYRQEASLSGAYRGLDYLTDYARYDTGNSVPFSNSHNGTVAGNFGYHFSPRTQARATARRTDSHTDEPNALLLFGLPDDQNQVSKNLYVAGTVEDQTTDHWHNLVRYGALRFRTLNNDPAPFGILDNNGPTDANCFGPQFIGKQVTIRGANGFAVSGQAFTSDCPFFFPETNVTDTNRDFVYGQTDYAFSPKLVALAGFRYENERGSSFFSEPGFTSLNSADRDDYLTTLQVGGNAFERLYYTVGAGLEHNSVFGFEATPRVSLAYYALRAKNSGVFSGSKLRFNFGKGVLEPTLLAQTDSVFGALSALPNGQQLINQFHISQVRAARSRSYDGGIEQQLFSGRAVAGITYFHNEFGSQLEFVSNGALTQLGIPPALAQILSQSFCCFINSLSYRAEGVETTLEYRVTPRIFARAGYTYVGSRVQHSFSSDNLFPSINPNFPNIPIGAFSPLVGGRPFRIAPHSGYFALSYAHSRIAASLTGTLVGRRDDSDFLFADAAGGTTLLLPNRNLDPAYQRLAFAGEYQLFHSLAATFAADNLLSQHYQEVIGFPALPFTFRAGFRVNIGGESWRLK